VAEGWEVGVHARRWCRASLPPSKAKQRATGVACDANRWTEAMASVAANAVRPSRWVVANWIVRGETARRASAMVPVHMDLVLDRHLPPLAAIAAAAAVVVGQLQCSASAEMICSNLLWLISASSPRTQR
jgi:hypothetical protein